MPNDGIYLSSDTYRSLHADQWASGARSALADEWERQATAAAPEIVNQAIQQAQVASEAQDRQARADAWATSALAAAPEALSRAGSWAAPSDTPQEAPQATPPDQPSTAPPDMTQPVPAPAALASAPPEPAPVPPTSPPTPAPPVPSGATQPATPTTAGLSGGGDLAGRIGPREQSILAQAGQMAQERFGPDGAKALQAVLVTEGGMAGARGDSGQSAGPLQFYEGGQLANYARAHGLNLDQAKQAVEADPLGAIDWALGTYQKPGYLGAAIKNGLEAGLSGADLATHAQRTGQVSVSPERAGQNYQALFGLGGQAIASAPRDPSSILDAAKPFIGQPYVWGGKSPDKGFDCSGLAGYLTTGQPESTTTLYGKSAAVNQDKAQPGDLVFWNMGSSDPHLQHVAVYLGNGQIVQSGGDQRAVNIGSVGQSIGSPPEFRRVGPGGAPAQAAAPAGAPSPADTQPVAAEPGQTPWDRIGQGISSVFKSVFGGSDPSATPGVNAGPSGEPATGANPSTLGTVIHKALSPFGGASEEFPTGGPVAGPIIGGLREAAGYNQMGAEGVATIEPQLMGLLNRRDRGEPGLDAQIADLTAQYDRLTSGNVYEAGQRNPSIGTYEGLGGVAQTIAAAPLAAEGMPLVAKGVAAAIDPMTGLPAVAGRAVSAAGDLARSGQPAEASAEFATGGLGKWIPPGRRGETPEAAAINENIANRLGVAPTEVRAPDVPAAQLAPESFAMPVAQPSTDTLVGMINWAKDKGADTSALERQLSFMQKMQGALGSGDQAQAGVGLATHLAGGAAGGSAAYLGTDENDPNRILKIAGGAAAGSAAAGFGLSAAHGAMTATHNAQPMLPGIAGAVSGPELFRAYHTNNVISGLATLTHVTVNSILAPAWSFGTRGAADVLGATAGLATGGRVGLDTGFSRVQGSGIGLAAGLATAGEDFGAALANHFSNPNSVANRAGGIGGALLNAQSSFAALHGAAQAAAQGIVERTELGRLAGEEATRQGLKGVAWTQAVANMIDHPIGGMAQEAIATARRAVLRGDPGTYGQTMQRIANVPYIGNTLFPVVRISANSLAQGLEKSPLGLVGTAFDVARGAAGHGPYGGPAGFAGNGIVSPLSERLTNNIAGTALTAWLASKAMDGAITGDGPSDPGQKAELMAQGWQPNSVYVPGKGYIDFHLLGPLAMPMALAGAYGDAVKYGGPKSDPTSDPEAIAAAMFKHMGKYLEDATGMRTIGQLYDVFHTQGVGLKQAGNAGVQFGASLAGGFVPESAFVRGITTATDPLARKAAPGDMGEALKMGLPVLREQLPVKQDVLGRPEANNQAGLGVFSPRTGTGTPDSMIGMLESAGVRFPPLPSQVAVSSRYAVDLTPDEKLQFQTERGQLLTQIVSELPSNREFAQASIEKRQQILQRAFAQADKIASKQIVSQIPEAELEQRVIANKNRRAPVGFATP